MEKVTLTNPTEGIADIELSVGHAAKLLGMENNGGWTLPKNSPFVYSKKNGITLRAGKGNNSEPKE